MNYTKIIATLGPSSETKEMIKAILEAGCRVIRLNFSHGSHSEQQKRYDYVRQIAGKLAIPVT
ncbi:MAG: pyruvate kinase, partial [Spirochaetia bacterium]|nr:pyruvate kinase [Spirochaetia bacterium]